MSAKEFDIVPAPKPRMTQRDKWRRRPCVQRYLDFKDDVRRLGIALPEFGCHIVFILPMAKSWTAKKKSKYNGTPHRQTPDCDNLGKAIMDAVLDEDCRVWDIRISKLWGYTGKIIISGIDESPARFEFAIKEANNRLFEKTFK